MQQSLPSPLTFLILPFHTPGETEKIDNNNNPHFQTRVEISAFMHSKVRLSVYQVQHSRPIALNDITVTSTEPNECCTPRILNKPNAPNILSPLIPTLLFVTLSL